MTTEEAEKVCGIMMTADAGCEYCAGSLLQQFAEAFPEHATYVDSLFDDEEDEAPVRPETR